MLDELGLVPFYPRVADLTYLQTARSCLCEFAV
jgi:hypothetical protein